MYKHCILYQCSYLQLPLYNCRKNIYSSYHILLRPLTNSLMGLTLQKCIYRTWHVRRLTAFAWLLRAGSVVVDCSFAQHLVSHSKVDLCNLSWFNIRNSEASIHYGALCGRIWFCWLFLTYCAYSVSWQYDEEGIYSLNSSSCHTTGWQAFQDRPKRMTMCRDYSENVCVNILY